MYKYLESQHKLLFVGLRAITLSRSNFFPKCLTGLIASKDFSDLRTSCRITSKVCKTRQINAVIPSKSYGFTLIEILVVLLIISIIATAAAFVVGRSLAIQNVRNTAQRLSVIMPLAQQQALLQAVPVGLEIDSQGYQFWQFQDDSWQPLPQALFSYHAFPDRVTIKLIINNKTVDLSQYSLSDSDEENTNTSVNNQAMPQIIFSTTGDITPFQIIFNNASGSAPFIVKIAANGNIIYSPVGKKQR